MKILLDGYFDRNFGDDMMLRIVASQLPEYDFCVRTSREMFIPFENSENIRMAHENETDFDAYLRVTGSGFIVPNKIAMLYAAKYYLDGRMGKRKRYRSATLGCNIERFKNPVSEMLMRSKIRENGLITCRDEYSLDYLQKCAKKTVVKCYPDVLFGMANSMIFPDTGEECVGICPSYNRQSGAEEYIRKIAFAADKAYEDGRKILLFSFDSGIENDLGLVRQIKKRALHGDNFEVISHDGNGDSIMYGFSRCSVILGTRFHSIVTAIRTGKNFVPIAYNLKTKNMLKDLGFCGTVLAIDDFDEKQAAEKILRGGEKITLNEQFTADARQHSTAFREWL